MPAPLPKPAQPPVKNAAPVAAASSPVPPPKPVPASVKPPQPPSNPPAAAPTPKQVPTPQVKPAPAPKPVQTAATPAGTPGSGRPPAPTLQAKPSMPPAVPGMSPAPASGVKPAPVVQPPTVPQPQTPTPTPGQPTAQPPGPQLPQQPVRVQQPPQTLTALSSMASNRLPTSGSPIPQQPVSTKAPDQKPTAAPTAPAGKSPTPEVVQPKKSVMRFLPFIGGGILLLLIVGFIVFRFLGGSGTNSVVNTGGTTGTGETTGGTTGGTTGKTGVTTGGAKVALEYWGLWEPTETMAAVIQEYEAKNPNVTIKYNKQSYQDYRVRLQNALNSENGPDIFRYHASWVPMLRQQLAALPTSVMTPSDYQNTFYPVAVNQLQSNGQIVGIPLMYDGLVLFYNKELFETAVVEPPKTWSDLRTVANQLKLESGSTLTRGGIALGNATNVEHFADIIALLILQNGGDLSKPNSPQVRDALLFYTNFINTDKAWSESLPSSTIAFARGDVAMMIAPSWRAHDIKAQNPDLKFATAPLPQLSETRTTWATYWAEGVNDESSKKEEAWKFLKYLSSKEVQQRLYAEQAKTRSFGELYSRKDLANELAGDPVASAIMQDAPYAKGWQMSTYTHDDGVNDQINKYYEDAVTALLNGEQVEDVQETLTQGVTQVLRQYGISSSE